MEKRSCKNWIRALFCLAVLPLCMAGFIRLSGAEMVNLGPDARVYLSIADNVLSTGHFIQTVRPAGSSVVPFGLPLILTVFRALGMGVPAILFAEYLIFGGTCWLLSQTEKDVLGGGWLSPLFFTVAMIRTHLLPNSILLEFYYLFLLAGILRTLADKKMPEGKRIVWLNALGFGAFCIRTVLSLVYLPILIYTICSSFRRRLRWKYTILLLTIPALVTAANTAINHRETGHWIVTANYAGSDIYLANNPHTRPTYFSSDAMPDFVSDEYFAIKDDPEMDPTEKDALYSSLAKQWIRENPGTFLRNTAGKFRLLFIHYWRKVLILCFLCAAAYIAWMSPHRKLSVTCLAINLLIAFVTSMGLVLGRYTIPVWPLASVHLAAGGHGALRLLRRIAGERENRSFDAAGEA